MEQAMEANMENVAKAYTNAVRLVSELRDKMANIITQVDERFGDDEEMRRVELKRVQRGFYRAILADQLRDDPQFESMSDRNLVAQADAILDKKGYVSGRSSVREGRRSSGDERLYGALRVRWGELCRWAGVSAIVSRGG
jgi:hypothetical protein